MKNKMIRKWLVLCGLAGMLTVSLTACQSRQGIQNSSAEEEQEKNSETEETERDDTEDAVEKKDTEDIQKTEENTDTEISYGDLENVQFLFSSGVGGWCTTLDVKADGSFSGFYHDSDMGDAGEDYPNGTYYYSEFSGKFAQLEQINDYTYATTVDEIQVKNEVGTEEIIDGVKYVYSEPYGLENAGEILFYTKGAPVSELPEGYLSWVQYNYDLGATLPFYGLYNVQAEDGFAGQEYDAADVTDVEADDTREELAAIEQQADELTDELENAELTQQEYNEIAGELYQLWDDELNVIWCRLKDTLSAEEMEQLKEEERDWITEKDSQMKQAGEEAEGGSMQSMLEYETGAKLTRERVYELADML